MLKSQFQKAVEEFNSQVDSDADAKIHGSYLDDVKKKLMDIVRDLATLMKRRKKQ